jgi:hypothetical protein
MIELRSPWLLAVCTITAACGGGSGEKPNEPAPEPEVPESVAPYPRPDYALLSETGLYAELVGGALAGGVRDFTPEFPLWSDGADKRRWVRLPAGARIDTSDPDRWQVPVGTKFWKEFSMDGVRLETRLIERFGEGPTDFLMAAFAWRDDDSDAEVVIGGGGQSDVRGTAHDVPSEKQCRACHNGEPGRVLGFSALQLAHDDAGLTLSELTERERLSAPLDADPADITPPGDEATRAAFGYLHANCGHCHNLNGTAWPDTQMVLRLSLSEREAEDTQLFQSVVGRRMQYFRDAEVTHRVVPGSPDESGLLIRMQRRGPQEQMPPLGTELVDDEGSAAVREWISALPTELPLEE